MSAADLVSRTEIAPTLSRRALDLARDELVPTRDGSAHLARLAMGRLEVLEAALVELDRLPSSPDVVCAHLLVSEAISVIERAR